MVRPRREGLVNRSSKSSSTWDRTIPAEVVVQADMPETDVDKSSVDETDVGVDGFLLGIGISGRDGSGMQRCFVMEDELSVEVSQIFVIEWDEGVFRVPEDLFLAEFNILRRGGRRGRETVDEEGFVLPVDVELKRGL